jgi:hypothetical protein
MCCMFRMNHELNLQKTQNFVVSFTETQLGRDNLWLTFDERLLDITNL